MSFIECLALLATIASVIALAYLLGGLVGIWG